MRGRVKNFDLNRKYGWIASNELDRDVFVHAGDLKRSGVDPAGIEVGDELEFNVSEGADGRRHAVDLRPCGVTRSGGWGT